MFGQSLQCYDRPSKLLLKARMLSAGEDASSDTSKRCFRQMRPWDAVVLLFSLCTCLGPPAALSAAVPAPSCMCDRSLLRSNTSQVTSNAYSLTRQAGSDVDATPV